MVIKIGKPTHYRPPKAKASSCGVIAPDYSTENPRYCDCIRCFKTTKFKKALKEL